MSSVIEHWLGNSRQAIHRLEEEMSQHQIAIQQAMAAIRSHTEYIHHLQHHLEIIRHAACEVDDQLGANEFEDSFSEAFGHEYAELESAALETSDGIPMVADVVDSNARSAPVLPIHRERPHAEAEAAAAPRRLPPPPPGYARARP